MTAPAMRRADQAREIHHGRIHGDGIAEVAAVFDHLDDEGLPAGMSKALMLFCAELRKIIS